MSKKMLIDATHAEETRVVVVDGNKVDEFDFESLNKRQLAGNIYLAKVTRVEPSLQAAFVDYGGNRHGFLAFSEIHPDYYQIPAADRQAILEEEAEYARAKEEADEERAKSRQKRNRRKKTEAAADGAPVAEDAVIVEDAPAETTTEETSEDVNEPTEAVDVATELPSSMDIADVATDTQVDEPVEVAEIGEQTDQDTPVEKQKPMPRKPRARRYKIQEVVKVRQILLIQVVKEERGNKGAAVTTYLSLAGRYCVLMPNTARGGGISRKITNVSDRKKLKDIAAEMDVQQGAGLIIRTAGSQRTKAEIRRDYEYLLRQWEEIRELTFKSMAPAHIYEEGSLIRRSIRDLYTKDIDEILVEGERGFKEAHDYMNMLMPSHAKNVKQYNAALPLFSRFQVEGFLSAMFNPTVQLKSGGYIVIGITEALVAIDVNSGRATKEKTIEDTAVKTNLEAAEEVARQLRLRDLAGLIVIDFIDMEDRRNNLAVEKRIKDKLKTDRARIQIGRISSFGLMEMSRQRLRPGMLEASTQPCPHCHGTGITRSNDSMALAILRELEEEGVRQRSKEVLVTAPVEVANYLLNSKREHIAMVESRFGLSVRVEADPSLISPEYRFEKFKVATRIVPIPEALPMINMDNMPPIEETEEEEVVEAVETTEEQPKKRRRRRRRGGRNRDEDQSKSENGDADVTTEVSETVEAKPEETADSEEKPKRSRSRRRTRKPSTKPVETSESTDKTASEVVKPAAEAPAPTSEPEAPKKRARATAKAPTEDAPVATPEPTAEPTPQPDAVAKVDEKPAKAPKKRGWWSLMANKKD
ncbi:MAG: Rne/Rng family ribonuclease [Rhodobacteraceae bacterium]|nr:Rne/Rng family ribonuclease [Paracoccaceae bacterium]